MGAIAYDDALFRAQFPEFSDAAKYPEVLVEGYWDMSTNYINIDGFGMLTAKSLPLAVNQCTAHMLVLAKQAGRGKQAGFKVATTVDKVSVSVLPPPVKDQFSWWLSGSPYGQQLLALLEVAGVGGFSVGGMPERGAFRKVGGGFN